MKVAKLLIALLVTGIAVQMPSKSISQNTSSINLKARITIGAKPIRFDSLVTAISKQTKVQFSFNTRKITPDKTFVLKPGEQTLENVLSQIKSKTGIYYKIIGNHIILLDKRTETNTVQQSKNSPHSAFITTKTMDKKTPAKKPVKKNDTKSASSSKSKKNVEPEDIVNGEVQTSPTAADYFPIEEKNKDTLARNTEQVNTLKEADSQTVSNTDSAKLFSGSNDTSRINPTSLTKVTADSNLSNAGNSGKQRKSKSQKLNVNKTLQLFAGVELLRTTDIKDEKNYNLNGWGINLKLEKRISRKFSGMASFGLAHFTGEYASLFLPFTSTGDTTIKNFTLTPLLAGIRYKLGSVIYLSAEGGVTFKNKINNGLLPILTPSAGVLLPIKGNRKIDIGLKFSHTVSGPSIPENPILQKGGYSFLSIRLAYGF